MMYFLHFPSDLQVLEIHSSDSQKRLFVTGSSLFYLCSVTVSAAVNNDKQLKSNKNFRIFS